MARPRVYFPGTMWPFYDFARPIIEPVAEVVVQPDHILRGAELAAVLGGVDGAILTAYEQLTREVLEAAGPRLRVLSKYGVGIESIDLEAATELGIPVANTPGANSLGVAEHTVALMLASLRQVRQLDRLVREGRWNDARKLIGGDVEGSTLGLVGYGNVGQLVGRRATGLGMRVLAYDPYQSAERIAAAGAEKVDDLGTMLGACDVVSLHMVVTPQTRGIFDAARFGQMKPGAVFVNTARAALVDQDALIEALRSGHLSGAGIDVPEPEPLGSESPLFEVENLLITPHHAGTTIRTRERTLTQAAENLVLMLDGGLPDIGLVNPEVRERFEARGRSASANRPGQLTAAARITQRTEGSTMTAASGATGTIAWLKPGAVDRESLEIFDMTPPDVRLAAFTSTQATNMTEREFDAEAYDRRQRPEIIETVRGMAAYAHPAFIAVTGDLIQSTMGLPWNRSLVKDIEAATGSAAATAMTAVTDALTFLGAQRVSVATPYGPGKNAYTRAYLEAAGFEVAVIDGWNAPSISIRDLKAIPEGAPFELGKRVVAADRDTDALFVPCPVWSVCPYIAPLEDATGVPVLTILNTVVWRGLNELGHPGGVRGYGRLLERAIN